MADDGAAPLIIEDEKGLPHAGREAADHEIEERVAGLGEAQVLDIDAVVLRASGQACDIELHDAVSFDIHRAHDRNVTRTVTEDMRRIRLGRSRAALTGLKCDVAPEHSAVGKLNHSAFAAHESGCQRHCARGRRHISGQSERHGCGPNEFASYLR